MSGTKNGSPTQVEALEAECASLRRDKELLERLLDAVTDTIFVFEPSAGRPLWWNRPFRELAKATDEEIGRSRAPTDWYEAGDLERAARALDELEATGRAGLEMSLVTRDGRRVPTEYRATVIEGFLGVERAVVAIGRDISVRLEAERSQALIDVLVDRTPTPTWISDRGGTLRRINQACCELLGVAAEQLIGRYNVFADNIVKDQGRLDQIRQVYEQHRPACFMLTYDVGELDGFEYQRTQRVHLEISVFPILDAGGELTHVVYQHHNLTDLVAAHAALEESEARLREEFAQLKAARVAQQQSEQRYRAVIESIPDPVVVLDRSFRHLDANEASVALTTLTREELRDTPFYEMLPGGREHPAVRVAQRVMETRQVDSAVDDISVPGQPKRWTLTSGYPVPDGVMLIARDITEQKNLEDRLLETQKFEALGTLAGGIAHDFNNLLTSVQGHASLMLLDLPEGDPKREHCKQIEKVVRSAASLTQQLLGFARGGKYQVLPTDIDELVDGTVSMFGRTRKQLRIHRKAAPGLWYAEVDRSQIEQVLLNLLVNAWQAMPAGGDLFVETTKAVLDADHTRPFDVQAGRFVRISVTDTGVGMDEATLARVFEPFFTTREVGRGTGLGLASAYGIVRSHGGILTADSEPGKGATFDIHLPATDEVPARGAAPAPRRQSGSETILLIDDEEMVRSATARLLERLGYHVLSASSARQGLEVFQAEHHRIDLILLDMILPGENPREAFVELRGIEPEVKVLLCSGYSLNGMAADLLDLGCAGFLQKPFELDALSNEVREVLDRR